MKALYTKSRGEYGLESRPEPVPNVNDAVVKVDRAALCHTDVDIRNGTVAHVNYPVIPGHEFAGTVVCCGSAVKHLKPGERVAVHTILGCGECRSCRMGDQMSCENYDELGSKRDGGFAEYCSVPARHLHTLPDHVTFEEAAMAEPLANAVSAVTQSDIQEGQQVVIIGPGPIGLLTLQVARLANPSILALVGTRDERLALGTKFGATHLINIKRDVAVDELKNILGKKGAQLIIECSGSCSAMELAIEIVGWRGCIALEGTPDMCDLVQFSPFRMLHTTAAVVRGINGWLTKDFVRGLDLMSSGLVDVKPLITHFFPLEEWEAAFDMITNRKSEAIKVEFTL